MRDLPRALAAWERANGTGVNEMNERKVQRGEDKQTLREEVRKGDKATQGFAKGLRGRNWSLWRDCLEVPEGTT